jgi:hypothetical protein
MESFVGEYIADQLVFVEDEKTNDKKRSLSSTSNRHCELSDDVVSMSE